jgi:CheY-like chemotaxis protein
MREIVGFLLEDAGYEVQLASNGPEALAMLDEWDPSAAVIDYMMPGMNGFELGEQLKARRPNIHVVMTTANGSRPPERSRLDEFGIAHYVTKPFAKADLLKAMPPA